MQENIIKQKKGKLEVLDVSLYVLHVCVHFHIRHAKHVCLTMSKLFGE
jgi:hypothetical protein